MFFRHPLMLAEGSHPIHAEADLKSLYLKGKQAGAELGQAQHSWSRIRLGC